MHLCFWLLLLLALFRYVSNFWRHGMRDFFVSILILTRIESGICTNETHMF